MTTDTILDIPTDSGEGQVRVIHHLRPMAEPFEVIHIPADGPACHCFRETRGLALITAGEFAADSPLFRVEYSMYTGGQCPAFMRGVDAEMVRRQVEATTGAIVSRVTRVDPPRSINDVA